MAGTPLLPRGVAGGGGGAASRLGYSIHLCCIAHNLFLFLPILGTDPHRVARLPLCFCCTSLRSSNTTPVSPSIRKCTTLRWTLWCCHDNVAKRQQFSCPPRTTTLSLKLENVIPVAPHFECFCATKLSTHPPSTTSTGRRSRCCPHPSRRSPSHHAGCRP